MAEKGGRKSLEEKLADVQAKITELRSEEAEIKKKIQDKAKAENERKRGKITDAVFKVVGDISPEEVTRLLHNALAAERQKSGTVEDASVLSGSGVDKTG